MRVHGALVALIDVPAELTAEYNRWYDVDHLPEHVAKADVLVGRRYVAPRDLQALGRTGGGAVARHAPYLTVYYHGIEDFDAPEAWGGWTAKDRVLVKAGRFFRDGTVVASRQWRLAGASTASGVHVGPDAVPYLAHRGVILAWGRAASADGRADALAWWDDVHLPDLLAVDGVLGALRFAPTGDGPGESILHLLLLEADPATVMPAIDATIRYEETVGRFPPHRGVYEAEAFLPYRAVQPFEYDFDIVT